MGSEVYSSILDINLLNETHSFDKKNKSDTPPSPPPCPDIKTPQEDDLIMNSFVDIELPINEVKTVKKIYRKKPKKNTVIKCNNKECSSKAQRRGYCKKHYEENKNKKCKMCNNKRERKKLCRKHFFEVFKCVINECNKDIYNIKSMLCRKHYDILKNDLG